MTAVVIDIDRDLPGGRANAVGSLRFMPSRRRIEGDVVVVQAQFVVEIPREVPSFTVDLAPTGPGWCWQITEAAGRRTLVRHVAVPDSDIPVQYVDLIDVDPATLEPSEPAVPAWEAAVQSVRDLRDDTAALIPLAKSAATRAETAATAAADSATAAAGSATAAESSAGSAAAHEQSAQAAATRAQTAADFALYLVGALPGDPA
ncbi:hypothetical protein [uncultured Aeromicrobium sp.]|uniref:hypothetical protein n=1 Tax=uncultured Aeromicrobium sp. TaxID=337820 RepID=UPI0025EB3FDA|nr:hypothetical protein [uncultured Aeromicrobium sp.]